MVAQIKKHTLPNRNWFWTQKLSACSVIQRYAYYSFAIAQFARDSIRRFTLLVLIYTAINLWVYSQKWPTIPTIRMIPLKIRSVRRRRAFPPLQHHHRFQCTELHTGNVYNTYVYKHTMPRSLSVITDWKIKRVQLAKISRGTLYRSFHYAASDARKCNNRIHTFCMYKFFNIYFWFELYYKIEKILY